MKKPKISIVVPIDPKRKTEIVDSIKRQRDKCIPILEESTNTARNRNVGMRKAKTEIVAFSNMHSHLSENWSEKVLEFFEEHPEVSIVGGPHLTLKGESKFGRVSSYALGSVFGAAAASSRYNTRKLILDADEKYLTTANLACRKEVVKNVQFDETLYPGEDPNFIASAKEKKFKVAYSPEIVVYQRRREKLKDFAKQIFFYGTARPKKESFLTTLKMPSFLIPPLFVIYLAFLPTLAILNILFLLPFFTYIFLNIGFSLYESVRNRDMVSVFSLPFIFFTIHLSYGLGFLYGFIQKVSKK